MPRSTMGSSFNHFDWSAEWMHRWCRKLACEDVANTAPKHEVVDEFVRYGD